MKKLFILAFIICGCAPIFQSGVADVTRGLVKIEKSLDAKITEIAVTGSERIEHCRSMSLPLKEQRKACLGDFDGMIPTMSLQKMRDVYRRMVEDLSELNRLEKDLEI